MLYFGLDEATVSARYKVTSDSESERPEMAAPMPVYWPAPTRPARVDTDTGLQRGRPPEISPPNSAVYKLDIGSPFLITDVTNPL
jgi:hypothetical protein